MQDGGASLHFVAHVDDAGADGSLVALSQESRHVGLYHHVFAGHGLALNLPVHHILCVGHAKEAPGGEAFGQGELHLDDARRVGHELWHEEGRLLQVLAQLYLGLALLLYCPQTSRIA